MKNKLRKLMIACFATVLVAGSSMTVFADEIHGRDVTFEDFEYGDIWRKLEPGATMLKDSFATRYYQYDSVGNIIRETTVYLGGTTVCTDFEYDELNRIVKQIVGCHIFEYQYIGNDINVLRYMPGEQPELRAVYSYDDSGKLIRLVEIYNNTTIDFQYDENNNLVAVIENGSVSNTYTYDSLNRLIENNGTYDIHTYKYNSENQIIEEARFDKYQNCITDKEIYTYDALGNISTVKDGTYSKNYIYDYDEAGRLLRVTKNNVDDLGTSSSIAYEYAY